MQMGSANPDQAIPVTVKIEQTPAYTEIRLEGIEQGSHRIELVPGTERVETVEFAPGIETQALTFSARAVHPKS